MRIAILSESPSDEAALGILVEGLLGVPIDVVSRPERGWSAVSRAIGPVLKELHYRRTADALVISADSDNTAVHNAEHATSPLSSCRYCGFCEAIRTAQSQLRPVGLPEIQVALAIPTPCIEAWYLYSLDKSLTEAGWIEKVRRGVKSSTEGPRLKRDAYGASPVTEDHRLEVAMHHANRIRDRFGELELAFPNSFGLFASDVRRWGISPPASE